MMTAQLNYTDTLYRPGILTHTAVTFLLAGKKTDFSRVGVILSASPRKRLTSLRAADSWAREVRVSGRH